MRMSLVNIAATLKVIRIALKKIEFRTNHTVQCPHQKNIVLETYPIHKVSFLRWLRYDCYPI